LPPACTRPRHSSEEASPYASHHVLCNGPTKEPLGRAHDAPLPTTTKFPGHGVLAPRLSIQKRPVRGGRKSDVPHVPASAYPIFPSLRPTIPDFDRGCVPAGRAARRFLGLCGSRLTRTPALCTRSAQQPPLHGGLLPLHGQGKSDWATSRTLRGTRLSRETVSKNHARGRRAPAIMSTIRKIAPVRSQQGVNPHFAK